MGAYRNRMLAQADAQAAEHQRRSTLAVPVAWQSPLPERAALVTTAPTATQPAPAEVLAELPDPLDAPRILEQRLQALKDAPRTDPRVLRNYESVVRGAKEELAQVGKPQTLRLSLSECVQRALEHNYSIRYESYHPAISQTQLVEAEAAFDAEFFLDTSYDNQDRPTPTAFQPGASDTRNISGGFRKLLPTGMQASVSLAQQRSANNLPSQYQTLNPAWPATFVVAFTQPLLRNFGLEVNRAQINIRKAELGIAQEKFLQTVRDRLLDVESAYWALMQTRRTAAILAEAVAQNKTTYENMRERLKHDATEVEVANAQTRWLQRQVEYKEAIKNIRDAEDQLKNLLNDPDLLLSTDLEIIPTDEPFAAFLAIDQLAAVRTALDNRNEIKQARLAIEAARIGTAAAKNQTLPQLDLTFQYEVQGLGNTADNSFDNLTTNRFISYTVRAQLAYPLGNRARRAAYRRAQLQENQAIVGLHQSTDSVVQEVNAAVRTLSVRYAQVPPSLETVRSADRYLRSLQARTQRIDPPYLDSELGAVEQLTNARRTLLQVIANYNVALIALEKAKGTLLQYNNVVVADDPARR